MKRHRFNATALRLTLSLSLFLILLAAAGGFYVANGWLRGLATDTSHASADAEASHATVTTLQRLQDELAANRGVIERASNIVAESQSYQYQDEIIRDLNNYAAAAGIGITNYSFETDTAESDQTATSNVAPPSGINSTLVSITLANPIDYDSLLRFFYSVEQNLTKMQITNISLTKSGNELSSDALTIEVYIR
jgi:hypothetical protein